MNISITNACNRRCEYCFQKGWYLPDKVNGNFTEMSVATFDSILKWLGDDAKHKDEDIKRIKILGGEPLLHSDIQDIFKCCVDNNFKATLISNISIDENQFVEILSSPYITAIDGVLANTDWPSNQEQTFISNFTKLCAQTDMRVSISTTLLPDFDSMIKSIVRIKTLNSIYQNIRKDNDIKLRISPYAPNPKGSSYQLVDFTRYVCDFLNNLWSEEILDVHFDCPVNYCELNESAIDAFRQAGISVKTTKCSPEHGCPFDVLVDDSIIWCSSSPQIRLKSWRDFKSYKEARKALNNQWEEYWRTTPLKCDYTNCGKFSPELCQGVCCAKNINLVK